MERVQRGLGRAARLFSRGSSQAEAGGAERGRNAVGTEVRLLIADGGGSGEIGCCARPAVGHRGRLFERSRLLRAAASPVYVPGVSKCQ